MRTNTSISRYRIVIILLSLLVAFYIVNTQHILKTQHTNLQKSSKGKDGAVTANALTSSLATNCNASSILTDLTGHVASGDETKNSPPKKNTNLCPIQDLKNGRFVNQTFNRPLFTPRRGQVQQNTCNPNLFQPNQTFHNYVWEPSAVHSKGCTYVSFDKDSYCRIMRNKTIAILGDSISLDHFLSISHLLGVPHALPKAKYKFALLKSHVCNDMSNSGVVSNNNDGVSNNANDGSNRNTGSNHSGITTSTLLGKRDFYRNSVQDIANEYFPDVLVLNRGAHYVSDDELLGHLNNTLFSQLNDWQERCRLNDKKCLLIWRTSVPGHPNCTQFTKPSDSVKEMEELILQGGGHFHWDQFKEQNELVLEAFQRTNLSYKVMDSYHVNILRPDLHRGKDDCLHTVSRCFYVCLLDISMGGHIRSNSSFIIRSNSCFLFFTVPPK